MAAVEKTVPITTVMHDTNTEFPPLSVPMSESLRISGDLFYNTDEKLWISPQEQ